MGPRRVALVIEGSRGDVQPYVVAALALRRASYSVLVLGPSYCAELTKPFALDFFEFYPVDTKKDCQKEEMIKTFSDNNFAQLTKSMSETKTSVREEMLTKLVTAVKDFQPQLILSCYLSICDAMNVGIGLGIPVLFLGLQVMIASNHIPAFGMFPQLPTLFGLNRRLWDYLCRSFAEEMNKSSEPILLKLFGKEKEQFQPTMEEYFQICSADAEYPTILAASRALHGPLPPDFTEHVHCIGGLALESEDQIGAEFGGDLQAMETFLAAGDPPVYMGYGSMTCQNAKFMTLLSIRALMKTGQRAVMLRGWAELSLEALEGEPDSAELKSYCQEKVLLMDTAPHAALFPRCGVLVHHGGAGTLNASAASGIPTVIVPIFLDQYYHSDLVNAKGFGVGLKAMKTLTPDDLAAAIKQCLESAEIRQKAKEIAQEMSKEKGTESLVKLVNGFMEDYVETGRFIAEREALRKEVLETTWKNKISSWLGQCACFSETRKSEQQTP